MTLNIAKDLCRGLSGSKCTMPRLSDWALVAPSQYSISVDLADISTGGAGIVIPVNVKVYGSYFLSGLERIGGRGGMCSQIKGVGIGAGLGAGWGLPLFGSKTVGKIKMDSGLKKKIWEVVGRYGQGQLENFVKGLLSVGTSGGTRLIAGPDSNGVLTTSDFHGSFATVVGLGANFIVNGVSLGVVLVSKSNPILDTADLIHARAIGLMGGIGLATSLDIEASGMVYRVNFM